MSGFEIDRRKALKLAGATAFAMPTVITRAFAADQITVADVGGAPSVAIKKAFYDPFEKATGIKVIGIAHDSDPVTQFKLLVDTKSYIWDVSMVTQDHVVRLTQDKNYLAPLAVPKAVTPDILPNMLTDNWAGFSVFAIVMAYRADKFGGTGPQSWADYWDLTKFPGRRGLYKDAWGLLELALLADGVKPTDIYPIDVDRAFKKLEAIREHVSVWWSSGAQNTQILQNGEVDLSDTWSARAYAAMAAGTPIKMVWQGPYSVDGWSIPLGTPRLEQAQKFVAFCLDPQNQATYSTLAANGPTNKKAFEFIAKDRAEMLPSAPQNFVKLFEMNAAWWGKNYDSAAQRMQEFLLQ